MSTNLEQETRASSRPFGTITNPWFVGGLVGGTAILAGTQMVLAFQGEPQKKEIETPIIPRASAIPVVTPTVEVTLPAILDLTPQFYTKEVNRDEPVKAERKTIGDHLGRAVIYETIEDSQHASLQHQTLDPVIIHRPAINFFKEIKTHNIKSETRALYLVGDMARWGAEKQVGEGCTPEEAERAHKNVNKEGKRLVTGNSITWAIPGLDYCDIENAIKTGEPLKLRVTGTDEIREIKLTEDMFLHKLTPTFDESGFLAIDENGKPKVRRERMSWKGLDELDKLNGNELKKFDALLNMENEGVIQLFEYIVEEWEATGLLDATSQIAANAVFIDNILYSAEHNIFDALKESGELDKGVTIEEDLSNYGEGGIKLLERLHAITSAKGLKLAINQVTLQKVDEKWQARIIELVDVIMEETSWSVWGLEESSPDEIMTTFQTLRKMLKAGKDVVQVCQIPFNEKGEPNREALKRCYVLSTLLSGEGTEKGKLSLYAKHNTNPSYADLIKDEKILSIEIGEEIEPLRVGFTIEDDDRVYSLPFDEYEILKDKGVVSKPKYLKHMYDGGTLQFFFPEPANEGEEQKPGEAFIFRNEQRMFRLGR